MRTGRFRFQTFALPKRHWWHWDSPGTIQVLMVEVDEPIASGCRSVFWRQANNDDRIAYEQSHIELEVRAVNAEAHTARLVARLEGIADTALRP